MNTVEALTLRTTTALGKLADLQRRAENAPTAAKSTVAGAALKELSIALEALRAATDQIQTLSREVAEVRRQVQAARNEREEFVNLLPVACVWTDVEGAIEEANEAAAALLNVAARRLGQKTLGLFIVDRPEFFTAAVALREGRSESIEVCVNLRPRERRTRPVRIIGRRVDGDRRICWILEEMATEKS